MQESIAKRRQQFDKIVDSKWSLLGLSVLVFLLWVINQTMVACFVLTILASVLLVISKNGKLPLVITLMFLLSVSSREVFMNSNNIIILACSVFPLVSGCGLYRIIQICLHKDTMRIGQLTSGMIVATIVSTLGGSGFYFSWFQLLVTLGLSIVGFFIYFIYVNTIGNKLSEYISYVMIAIAGIIILEMFVFYVRFPDPIFAMQNKVIDLGWGISNNLASLLVMCFPFCFYLGVIKKHGYFYIVLGFLIYASIYFTFSRGNLLFSSIMLIPIVLYCLYRSERRFGNVIAVLAFFMLAVILIITNFALVCDIFQGMFDKGFAGSGREALYVIGLQDFMKAPIFGMGVYGPATIHLDPYNNLYFMYHCTLIQILVNYGIVGLLGYSIFFFQRYRTFVRKISVFKIFAVAGVLLTELYGLMDITFYCNNNVYMIIAICIAAELEENGKSIVRSKDLCMTYQETPALKIANL